MNLANSLMRDLVTEYSSLRPQIYFNSSLIALTRAMEDLVLASDDVPLVIANFQQEHFFRQQERRFSSIASKTNQVYVLAAPDKNSGFAVVNYNYETILLGNDDILAGEKCLVIIGQHYTACLVAQEKLSLNELKKINTPIDREKRFEGFWTFDRHITRTAADWLLGRMKHYRPELREKIVQAREFYLTEGRFSKPLLLASQSVEVGIFAQRLVTYLQAGQYKLIKAYRAVAVAERQENLINKIAKAQRQSLNPQEILKTTVQELGQIFPRCRCLLYRVEQGNTDVTIQDEFLPPGMPSLLGQKWSVADDPVFIIAQTQDTALVINDVAVNAYLQDNPVLADKIKRAGIESWLMVSIRYQKNLLGILELHYGKTGQLAWQSEDIALVEAVANSAGVALTQASAYSNLVQLNRQLAAVERIQNNLIAVVGHELRTPLSTIRVCLESLNSEPNMPVDIRSSMLDTALSDSKRLGQLIQDFLTLSKLEAGKAYRNIESLPIEYALNLALSRIKRTSPVRVTPAIKVALSDGLPSVLADVEGLVEVFYKLLDNACKFTCAEGKIVITANIGDLKKQVGTTVVSKPTLEVVISDTGRGLEANQLEIIFDRFSQSENYLRRTVSGVGLGLVICRQIVRGMGGQIWATSEGKDKGSQFHFTLAIDSIAEEVTN